MNLIQGKHGDGLVNLPLDDGKVLGLFALEFFSRDDPVFELLNPGNTMSCKADSNTSEFCRLDTWLQVLLQTLCYLMR